MDTSQLNRAEAFVVNAVQQRGCADFSDASWTSFERAEVPAGLITALCTGAFGAVPHQVAIQAAHITGSLDLEDRRIEATLRFVRCTFDARVKLTNATCRTLCFDGSRVPGIDADWLNAAGSVLLRDGFDARGEVRLEGATIAGTLDCSGSRFLNPGGVALDATGATTHGAVCLRNGFESRGEVRLKSARIGTELDCCGARFVNPGGIAVDADCVTTGAGAKFAIADGDQSHAACIIDGQLRLAGAVIGSDLRCDGLQLRHGSGTALRGRGVTIRGDLFLSDAAISGETELLGARIDGRFHLLGSVLDNPGKTCLLAAGATTGGSVFFGRVEEPNRRFVGNGTINFSQAQIGVMFNCCGATFNQPRGLALRMYGATVKGDVLLINGFRSEGELRTMATRVGGNFVATGAELNNPGAMALHGERLAVGGSIMLRRREDREEIRGSFKARGSIRLHRATMLALECDGAQISNFRGVALDAYGLAAAGDVLLRDGFSAEGTVNLASAKVVGRLDCTGAIVAAAPDRVALLAPRLSVDGDIQLHSARIGGRVVLFGASCANLECYKTAFDAKCPVAFEATALSVRGSLKAKTSSWSGGVTLRDANVRGNFELWDCTFRGSLNLSQAHVGMLADEVGSWPVAHLVLEGFTYDALAGSAPSRAADRLQWLARQPREDFRPQVYEQLARVLKQMGQESEAKTIAIAKREATLDRARARAMKLLLRWTVGHGYKPWRAFFWLLLMVGVGWAIFSRPGGMTVVPGSAAAQQRDVVPLQLQPLVYSIDTLLPVVDLQQEKYWTPDASSRWGRCVRFYLWVHIAGGWLLVTLLVAALSGIVKRE